VITIAPVLETHSEGLPSQAASKSSILTAVSEAQFNSPVGRHTMINTLANKNVSRPTISSSSMSNSIATHHDSNIHVADAASTTPKAPPAPVNKSRTHRQSLKQQHAEPQQVNITREDLVLNILMSLEFQIYF
jgi:hypothetical protein